MTAPVEKPAHVHPTRMRHIGHADLLAGLGRADAGIAAIRGALAGQDPPVWDPAARARAIANTPAADEVLTAADALLDRVVDFVTPEHGRSGLYGLHYLDWTAPLITAYELTGDDRYAACFGRLFDDWYASRDRVTGDWPGLDVVWYSLGVWARAAVLVPALRTFARSSVLSDRTVEAALATLLGGARWAAEEHDAFRPGNWQLVCAGELLHVAAFLPGAPEAPEWVATGRDRLVEHLERDFTADGGHHERSPGYHALCLEALQRAAVIGRRAFGLCLDEHPAFAAAHDWLAAMTTPAGWVPPWQDSTTVWPAELLARGAQILGRPVEDQRISRHLESSGYVVLRGAAGSYLGLNAGPYIEHELESHSHLAVTDFVLSSGGEPLAIEPGGPPTYDDPAYQTWYRDPCSHNTVTVDGETMRTDRQVVVDGIDLGGPVEVVAVHHHGYPYRVSRRIVHVATEPGYWLVSDEVEGGHAATWSVLAPSAWTSDGPGHRAGRLTVVATSNDGVRYGEGPGQVPGSSEVRTLYALRMHSATGRFDVVLADQTPWSITAQNGGWRICGGGFIDTLTDRSWERCTEAGELVGSAGWSLANAARCEVCP